jgi:hypothetical protein
MSKTMAELITSSKRKTYARSKIETRATRMFPTLHADVANAVSTHISPLCFHQSDSEDDSTKTYSTYVMGHFVCSNAACKARSWGSGKISIVIRGYPCNEYNATVYGQRCKACNELGRLKIDVTSYVDRVSHRLMVWAGVPMEPRQYVQKETLPHMEELCEACRRGVCRQQDI